MSQIIVAVATHKPYKMPDEPIYLPLHVGAELHPDALPDMQGGNTRDNSSALNASYSELIGLYWLWKNCDAQYKSLVHYRRLLGSADKAEQHQKDPYEKLVDGPELLSFLSDKDVVLAKQRNYYIETVYGHYSHTLDGSQLDKMRGILSECCPKYLPAWDNLMKSTCVHVFNMFVMPASMFDAYCAWLFPLLDELGQRIDTSEMDSFACTLAWPRERAYARPLACHQWHLVCRASGGKPRTGGLGKEGLLLLSGKVPWQEV